MKVTIPLTARWSRTSKQSPSPVFRTVAAERCERSSNPPFTPRQGVRTLVPMTTMRSPLLSGPARLALSATLSVLLTLSAAQALTVAEAPIEVLVDEAALVVHGHVVETATTRYNNRVWTRSTVAVWEELGGNEPLPYEVVDIHLPGGVEGSQTTYFPGVPTLTEGDEVVLLLDRAGPGWVPIGLRLGVLFGGPDDYGLSRATVRGRPDVRPTITGATLRNALAGARR